MIRWLILLLLRGYQFFISPLTPPSCRFSPSCSAYAREAVLLHGSARGLLLTFIRLSKCHPWHPGGIDQVPEQFDWIEVFHGR